MFAMMTLIFLFFSIVDRDLASVVVCILAAVLTYVSHNVRRTML
jgi:hypothetical protein